MAYRASGFTSVVNAATYGVSNVAEFFFPDPQQAVGTAVYNDVNVQLSAANVGQAFLFLTAGTNFGDLWTTFTAYTAGETDTVTNASLSVNTLTVTCPNTLV